MCLLSSRVFGSLIYIAHITFRPLAILCGWLFRGGGRLTGESVQREKGGGVVD